MARKTRNSKGSGIKVDLSDIETGGKVIDEGVYLVSVDEASLETSNNSGAQYIKFEFAVIEGKSKGYKLYHNCSLQPQALFNLKAVLAALGFEIPTKAFDLDLRDLIGLECSVEVAHELYEGKKKSRIVEFHNTEDSDDSDDEDDEDDIEELLGELDLADLKKLAKAVGVKAAAIKKAKDEDSLIELILEQDEDDVEEQYDELFGDDEDDEDDSDDEDDEDEDDDEDDYSDMTLAALKTECKDRGLKVKKGMKKEDLVDMLEEDDED